MHESIGAFENRSEVYDEQALGEWSSGACFEYGHLLNFDKEKV